MCYLRTSLLVCLGALALIGCKPKPEAVDSDAGIPAAVAPPLIALPPPAKLSPKGYQLILDFEVGGGKVYYSKFLAVATWPGASSGVTTGVGYNCGYNSCSVILSNWG